jgi:predicted regulator of Ras-like GTPase activity (Roadblock/LC7/MglB family)
MGDNGVGATAPPQAIDEQQAEDPNNNLVELQETVSRISAHKGIESVVIWKKGGDIVYSSQQPQGDSAKKAAAAQRLLQAAEDYFSGTNDDDDTSASTTTGAVSFVQVKTTSGKELLISPDQGFVLAVAKR